MNGVTGQICLLPVLTKLKAEPDLDSSCFKVYPENVFLHDIDGWRKTHLSENRAVKRRKMLAG